MKAISRVLCAVAIAALPCTSALADQFNFSFGGPHDPIYGYGTLTASATGNYTSDGTPIFLVTGISGVTAGQTITGVAAPGTFPVGLFGFQPGNDNLLSDPAGFDTTDNMGGDAFFDTRGLSYQLANGDYINLAENDDQTKGYNYDLFGVDGSIILKTSDEPISVSAVPEPESLALFGTGLLGVVGLVRRRFVS